MDLVNLISKKRILVIGDSILDEYIYGKVYRISPEAPVPVVLKSERSFCLGGSANVAQNVISLGARCDLITVIGNDYAGNKVASLCSDSGINLLPLYDGRNTTVKSRIIGNGHQIVRVDEESTYPIDKSMEDDLFDLACSVLPHIDGVIIQDYGKGMLSKQIINRLSILFSENSITVLSDPKDHDISKYSGSSIIKPNLTEFKHFLNIDQSTQLTIEDIRDKARELISNNDVGALLITLSENGMVYVSQDDFVSESGVKIDITDVSGAGDTVSAVFLIFLVLGLPIDACLHASNLAGIQVCKISGAVPVNLDTLISDFNRS